MLRVTSNQFSDSLVTQLQTLSRRQATYQTQIASGQRVQDASDDPLAAQEIFKLRDGSVARAQYQKNIEVHQEFATSTHSALQSLQKIINRAEEISVSIDGLDSEEDMKAYGLEVGELLKQAVQIANSEHRGEYIFAGTKSGAPAFSATYDASGNVSAVTFQGNTSNPVSEVAPGVLISSRVSGENRSGTGTMGVFADSRSGADLFAHLVSLQNQLLSGDRNAIETQTRSDLEKDGENLLNHLAGNGALQARLDSTLDANKDEKLSIESDLSKRTDTDLSDVLVRLSQQQTAYQATLQSAGSIMNLSLLSFLR